MKPHDEPTSPHLYTSVPASPPSTFKSSTTPSKPSSSTAVCRLRPYQNNRAQLVPCFPPNRAAAPPLWDPRCGVNTGRKAAWCSSRSEKSPHERIDSHRPVSSSRRSWEQYRRWITVSIVSCYRARLPYYTSALLVLCTGVDILENFVLMWVIGNKLTRIKDKQ